MYPYGKNRRSGRANRAKRSDFSSIDLNRTPSDTDDTDDDSTALMNRNSGQSSRRNRRNERVEMMQLEREEEQDEILEDMSSGRLCIGLDELPQVCVCVCGYGFDLTMHYVCIVLSRLNAMGQNINTELQEQSEYGWKHIHTSYAHMCAHSYLTSNALTYSLLNELNEDIEDTSSRMDVVNRKLDVLIKRSGTG